MRRGQHHPKLAWAVGGGLLVAGIAALASATIPHNETLWHLIAAPQEDGLWRFERIDGRDVSGFGYSVRVHWGEVSGWYNGCNYCGTSGEGMTICTLQACVEQPSDRLYFRFSRESPQMRVDGDRMVLTLPGHRAELVRFTERVI